MSTRSTNGARSYLGYRGDDAEVPWGRWFDPDMAPLPRHVVDAIAVGPVAPALMTQFDDLGAMLDQDTTAVETGYAVDRDGAMFVATRIDMPDVAPAMWDWWFAWHGDDDRKYKLWHPRAHLSARWEAAATTTGDRSYVGRTSLVEEYLGSTYTRASIRFVEPDEVGVDRTRLDADGATAICARLGLTDRPLDVGYLVHHVRPTERGAEMRSRFFVGGRYAAIRSAGPLTGRTLPSVVGRTAGPGAQGAADLLVHCAQEMGHLAGFLPALHADLAG